MIPTRPLKELLHLADSGTWGEPADGASGAPVLRSSNMQGGQLVLDDVAWRLIPKNDVERRRLASGDILVTKSSGSPDHIGKCCVFQQPDDGRDYYFSNFTLRLRVVPGVADWRWVFFWLSSSAGRRVLDAMNNTTTGLRNLSVSQYLDQHVPYPSILEQRRIADILDKADAVRRKRKEAIALTEELLRSAFLEMFGDPVTNPRGWNTVTIGQLAECGASLVDGPFGSSLKPEHYVDDGVRVIRNYNINDDHFDLSQFKYVTPEKFEELRRSEVRPGDILITTKGTVGDVCLMPDLAGPSVLSASGTVRLRLPEAHALLGEFVVSQMIQPNFKRYLHTFEAGSAQQYLNLSGIRKMTLVVPPETEQRMFCRMKYQIRELRKRLSRAADESDLLFDALVHRAFHGEL